MLLAAGLILAGCGDDDDDSDGEEATSPEEVKKQVDAICDDADNEAQSIIGELPQGGSQSDQAQAASDAFVPLLNDTLNQIRDVPGAEDEPDVAKFIDALEEETKALEDNPEQLVGGGAFTKSDAAAKYADLPACAG